MLHVVCVVVNGRVIDIALGGQVSRVETDDIILVGLDTPGIAGDIDGNRSRARWQRCVGPRTVHVEIERISSCQILQTGVGQRFCLVLSKDTSGHLVIGY